MAKARKKDTTPTVEPTPEATSAAESTAAATSATTPPPPRAQEATPAPKPTVELLGTAEAAKLFPLPEDELTEARKALRIIAKVWSADMAAERDPADIALAAARDPADIAAHPPQWARVTHPPQSAREAIVELVRKETALEIPSWEDREALGPVLGKNEQLRLERIRRTERQQIHDRVVELRQAGDKPPAYRECYEIIADEKRIGRTEVEDIYGAVEREIEEAANQSELFEVIESKRMTFMARLRFMARLKPKRQSKRLPTIPS